MASATCGKFSNTLPLRLYSVTLEPCTTANTRTPSSLTSRRLIPFILAGRSVESCASWQVKVGIFQEVLPKTLLSVFSLMPQRRSLINTRRHRPFHCSESNSSLTCSMRSLAACPVTPRVRKSSHKAQNVGHGLGRLVRFSVSITCLTLYT